jgi:hypothetical protein
MARPGDGARGLRDAVQMRSRANHGIDKLDLLFDVDDSNARRDE